MVVPKNIPMVVPKNISGKIGRSATALALAVSMGFAGVGTAFAAESSESSTPEAFWSTPSGVLSINANLLKTYGVRAGSAGGDFMGITNTNYNGSSRASYYGGGEDAEEPVNTIGIFAPSSLWNGQ